MTVDFAAIVDQLEGDPGFRARLRAVLLSDELLQLPERVARLEEQVAEMDARLTARLDALAERLDAFAEATERRFDEVDARFAEIDARFDEVDARFAEIDARFDEVDARFDVVEARLDEVDARFDVVEARLDKLDGDVGILKGGHVEDQVAAHPGRYLSDVLVRPVTRDVDAFDLSPLSAEDRRQLVQVDLVVAGRAPGAPASEPELLAAVEVSWRVHLDDLQRAFDRAGLLARAVGAPVLPVAVSKVDPGAAIVERAAELGLTLVVDDGGPPRTTGRVRAAA